MLWIACQFHPAAYSPASEPIAPEPVRLTPDESFQTVRLRMAQWALQFTPDVCLGQWAGSILLEVAPSLRLWGGLESLLVQLQRGWASLGWPAQSVSVAWAPTARAADWKVAWADCGRQTLAGLPLSCIPELAPHQTMLARMGLHQLGPLLKMPRAGLTQRLGPAVMKALDAGLGRRPDPHRPITLAASFEQTLEFALPTDSSLMLEEACQRLLTSCVAWLKAQQAGLRQAQFVLGQGRHRQQLLNVTLADLSHDLARIHRITCERLAREPLAAAVHQVPLRVQAIEPLPLETIDCLEGPQQQEMHIRELCERLQARLGEQQVLRIQLEDSHCPEAAASLVPTNNPGQSRVPPPTPASTLPPRPLWLLEAPQALSTQNDRPCYEGPLRLRAGPERIETNWWEEPVQRDYFIAETPDQRLIWVYRNPSHRWFLHGFFG